MGMDRINLDSSAAEILSVADELLSVTDILKDRSIEPEIKANYDRMVEMINDAIALRKINLAAAKMKVYHMKMKDESFVSLQNFIRD